MLWFVLPVALFIWLLIGTGPQLQDTLSRALSGSQPSIYDAAYGGAIMQFPTFRQWLVATLFVPYLPIALASAYFSVRANTLTAQAVSLAITLAFLLSLFDALTFALSPEFQTNLPISLVCNVAGAIGVAILYFVAGSIYVLTYRYFEFNRTFKWVISASVVVLFALACSTTLYVALLHFYDPVKVRIAVNSGDISDVMTAYTSADALHSGNKTEEAPFDFFPSSSIHGLLQITSAKGAMKTNWASTDPNQRFSATVYGFRDCMLREAADLPIGTPLFRAADVAQISLTSEVGHADLTTALNGTLSIKNMPFGMGNFERAESGEARNVTAFVSLDERVEYASRGRTDFIYGVTLMKSTGHSSVRQPRSIGLKADGIERRMIFTPPAREMDADDRLTCSAILPTEVINAQSGAQSEDRFTGGSNHVSLLVRVEEIGRVPEFRLTNQTLVVEGLSGWVQATDIPAADLALAELGNLGGFFAYADLDSVLRNDERVDVTPEDVIVAVGKFTARYDRGGTLTMSGDATALWRNQRRMNPTRWELFPVELKIAIGTALLAALGGFLTALYRLARRFGRFDVLDSLINASHQSAIAEARANKGHPN